MKYLASEPHFTSLRGIVDGALVPWCEDQGYEYHSRPKELSSIAEKIETGRYESWADLDDLVASAIVIPTHSHEPGVVDLLDGTFQRIDLRARGSSKKAPDVFRFDSTRWVGKLRHIDGVERSPGVADTLFEVQIRSAFEHAWSVTTHDLVFKGDIIDWRRARLVAQIKAAVEQIDMLIDGFEQGTDLITASSWSELEQRATLRACFVAKVEDGQIPPELRPKDWVRFADNLQQLIQASAPDRRQRDQHFSRCLDVLSAYSSDPPRSCSLLQTAMGVLSEAGLTAGMEARYVPLVTQEVEDVFPSLKAVSRRFQM